MNYFTVLTNIGAAKIAAATAANSTIDLTHIAIGDGNGTVPTPDIAQTELVQEVFRTALSELKVDESNANHIIARSVVPADEGNFWIREIGVFDGDGDLIAVGNYPETYKSILTEGAAKEVDLNVVFEVANADVVDLVIDPSIVMASQEHVEEKVNEVQVYVDDALENISMLDYNLLINPRFKNYNYTDFTTPVSIANRTYYFNRWIAGLNVVAGTIQQLNDGVKIVATGSGTGQIYIEQMFDSSKIPFGETLTVAVPVKSNSDKCSLVVFADGWNGHTISHTGDDTKQELKVTVPIGVSVADLRVRIGLTQEGDTTISNGDYFAIVDEIRMVKGAKDKPCLFNESIDEYICQMYFERFTYSSTMLMSFTYQNDYWFTFYFRTTKRIIPTITSSGWQRAIPSFVRRTKDIASFFHDTTDYYLGDGGVIEIDAEIY